MIQIRRLNPAPIGGTFTRWQAGLFNLEIKSTVDGFLIQCIMPAAPEDVVVFEWQAGHRVQDVNLLLGYAEKAIEKMQHQRITPEDVPGSGNPHQPFYRDFKLAEYLGKHFANSTPQMAVNALELQFCIIYSTGQATLGMGETMQPEVLMQYLAA